MGGAEDWADLAAWYDEIVEAGSGPHETALGCLFRLLPDLTGAAVLDVACGQGLATRALARAGAASVVGVDLAAPMIDLARRRTDPSLPVSYRVDDAQVLATCAPASFDGATCQLGLMDSPDLDAVLGATRRVLRDGGWFVFVIGHPAFLAPYATTAEDGDGRRGRLVTRYLEPGFWVSPNPHGIRGRAGNHHRPIGVYLTALVAAGFELDAVDEPRGSPLLLEQQPVYRDLPIHLAVRALAGRAPARRPRTQPASPST